MAFARLSGRGCFPLLAAAAALACLFAGCLEGPGGGGGGLIVEGEGYTTLVIDARSPAPLVDAALSDDGGSVALLYEDGTFELRALNGSRAKTWKMEEAPWSCLKVERCGLELLPNGTVLSLIKGTVFLHTLDGALLWQWAGPPLRRGIAALDAAANGTLLLAGFADGSAMVHNTLTAVEYEVPSANGSLMWEVSASGSGDVVAVSSAGVAVFNAGAGLLASVARFASVEVAGDGRSAVVWGRGEPGDDHDLVAVNLTATPPSFANFSVRDARGPGNASADMANRVWVSPNGRFAAVKAVLRVDQCHGGVCSAETRDYVRIVDLSAPSADYGFRDAQPVLVFLENDGSAFAVSSARVQSNNYQLQFTTASPRSTPPHQAPPPMA